MAHWRIVAAALVALPLAAGSGQASGASSEDDRERARALFAEGIDAVDRRSWAEAEDRFRRCLSIRRSAVVEYNLASVLEAQGELAEAALLLRGILDRPNLPSALGRSTLVRLERLAPRIAHLRIVLSGVSGEMSIAIDGQPIDASQLDRPVPIEPGRHRVVARDARGTASVAVEAGAGESIMVALALRVPADGEITFVAPRAASGVEASAALHDDEPPVARRRWLWTTTGLAVAGGVVASVLLTRDRLDEPTVGTFGPGLVVVEVGP